MPTKMDVVSMIDEEKVSVHKRRFHQYFESIIYKCNKVMSFPLRRNVKQFCRQIRNIL